MLRRIFPTSRFGVATTFGLLTAVAALAPGGLPEAAAQEPAACLSEDPADWPAPAKPYFMVLIDSSGSMISGVNSLNSCGFQNNEPSSGQSTRMGHAKCAVNNTVLAYGGQVNFGLSQFAMQMEGCGGNCYGDDDGSPFPACSPLCYEAELDQFGGCAGCGPRPGDYTTRRGGRVLEPVLLDDPLATPNVDDILQWVDNSCAGNTEIFNPPSDGPAYGLTPISGSLRDMLRYFQGGWTDPDGDVSFPSPLSAADPPCRSVNVILLTDGDETCDTNNTDGGPPANATGQARAVEAVRNLYNVGATFGGNTFRIRTHVINFAGGSVANTNQLADAGDDGQLNNSQTSYFATNETQLSQALSQIISGTVEPEVCDNEDNNCNGCTDEGYRHHCNTNPVCCTQARATCLAQYEASITAQDPDGNLALLPCTGSAAAQQPASWLCFDPGETCDNQDNNCVAGTDEGVTKCGDPAQCPTAEVCDGLDNDCDGVNDDGLQCNNCIPSPERCNGCDDDCDGIVDDGAPAEACGNPNIPGCSGTAACQTVQASVPPGSCQGPVVLGQCSAQGSAETCNGLDDDCDGLVDDGVPPQACVPPGTPPGQSYAANSQCRQGQQACTGNPPPNQYGVCVGYQGPSPEVCDGIDNDCDGAVDEGAVGVGQACGVDTGACQAGTTQCVNAALECSGGVGPTAESCNGVDDDCDGAVDETPLADAPPGGMNGCWTLPGNCCSHDGFTWCPPPGGTCNGLGTLGAPCSAGTLSCVGGGWTCSNSANPQAEVCDGLDNDCDGTPDDGSFPGEGEACGTDVGECDPGMTACTSGFLDCVGDTAPVAEECNGLDDDCDGTVDDGIVVGGSCQPEYDTAAYPGERIFPSGSCQLGILVCDGAGGTSCQGGTGPQPEVCDGLDNDCDGTADETGPAPDGIDGTTNPDDPDQQIGDECGVNEGLCAGGNLGCLNGRFECLGGQEPQVEACDCEDNDCDGTNDNPNPGNDPPLCSPGKDCVKTAAGCQCAAPCSAGEFPCPSGQECETVTSSETGEELGSFCVAEFCAGGCEDKTFTDTDGVVRCAPEGTLLEDCRTVPECVCKGQNGCVNPCFGVTCEGATVCARFGEQAGTCVPNNCFNVGCQGCDVFCGEAGECIANPCAAADACDDDEVCVASADGESFTCKASCADVECDDGTTCKDGACVAECSPACAADEVCDFGQTPAQCVDNQCNEDSCPNGGCCDPLTGACGTCPCEGVTCPDGEVCIDDECHAPGGSGTGGEGGATATSATATGTGGEGAGAAVTGTGAVAATGAGGESTSTGGVFGLATGGGGCQCEVGIGADRSGTGNLAAVAAAALLVAARRRRRRDEVGAVTKEVAR